MSRVLLGVVIAALILSGWLIWREVTRGCVEKLTNESGKVIATIYWEDCGHLPEWARGGE